MTPEGQADALLGDQPFLIDRHVAGFPLKFVERAVC